MPSKDVKEIFSAYDEEGDGMIDAYYIGDVCRALDCKPTQKQVEGVVGKKYEKGQHRIKYEEFQPMYEAIKKLPTVGGFADFCEGLKVYDVEGKGKILAAEVAHAVQALGERLSKEEADELMDHITVKEDENGQVAYEAFIRKVLDGPFPSEDE